MVDIFYPILAFSTFIVNLLGVEGRIAESLNFFIYDSIKIMLLLFFMIFILSIIRTYIPQKTIKKILSGKKLGIGNFLAALFGSITPFCSCSSIPIFLSFVRTGVPLGVTFSFLITSPIINEYLVALMLFSFGLKVTIIYVISGLLIGTISGIIIGKLKLEKYLEKDIVDSRTKKDKEIKYNQFKKRIDFGISESKSIVKKIWLWIIIGVGVGAIIHGFIPEELIHSIISKGGIFTVPIAVILGLPLYANCAAILPVAEVLFEKGIPLGTALAFMMSTSALSFPEMVILRRAMKLKLIAIFFGIVGISIIITGYLFNFII
jgi:uncharacterized protein